MIYKKTEYKGRNMLVKERERERERESEREREGRRGESETI